MEYSLNPHSQELLAQFRENLPVYQKIEQVALQVIQRIIKEQGITINSLEHRVKAEKSLAGKLELKGGKYTSHGDHRMVMALKVASLGASIPVEIDDVDCVAKSFPQFNEMFERL